MPVMGKYVCDCYENKASEEVRQKWRFRRPSEADSVVKGGDGSRAGPPLRILNREEMAKL